MIDTNSEAFRAALEAYHNCDPVKVEHEMVKGSKVIDLGLSNIASLAAALTTYEAAKWQPIETAPKDGSNIILGNDVTVAVGKWARDDWRAMYFVCEGTDDFRAGAGLIYKPTHWQPLPKSPPV